MKKSTKRNYATIEFALVKLSIDCRNLMRLLNKQHEEDVALYERNLAVAERCCDYSGRQTLVAEYMLNDRLASRTPPTEG